MTLSSQNKLDTLTGVKALTCDTGGTVLDWHSGFRDAFSKAGDRHRIKRNWADIANDLRRRSMKAMLNLGQNGTPDYNFDEAHKFCLDALLQDEGLEQFDAEDRHAIAWEAPHQFSAWPDVREGLATLRQNYIVCSFTILSHRLIIATARRNGLSWDAVMSCEVFGVYKLLPESYRLAAKFLQLRPDECLMVACHPYDLDAARAVGFKTGLIRRPNEWGAQAGNTPMAGETGPYDVEVDNFIELAEVLKARQAG